MRIAIMTIALILCAAPAAAFAQDSGAAQTTQGAAQSASESASAGEGEAAKARAAQDTSAAGPAQTATLDARGRAERIVEILLFDSGLFVAMMKENEPYMSPAAREALVPRVLEMHPHANREAAASYAATFDRQFADALAAQKRALLAAGGGRLREILNAEEMASLESFVLGAETGPLFLRMLRYYVERGGGSQALDRSVFTQVELERLRVFYESPGGRILRRKKRRMDALTDEALRAFASSFERTFMAGLCAAAAVECPSWVNAQSSR